MSLQEIIESFRTGLMLLGLWVLAAIAVGVVGAWLYRGVAPAMRRPLTVARLAAFVAVSAFYVIRGGAKFLMPPPSTGGTPVVPVAVTTEEIARGWRLCEALHYYDFSEMEVVTVYLNHEYERTIPVE